MAPKFTEADIAARIISWLRDLRWEIYQEVDCGSGVADIVAVQGCLTWVIETKKSLSLDLLSQANDRLGHAHLVSVAIPYGRRAWSTRTFAVKTCRTFGIGIFRVGMDTDLVQEELSPKLNRRPSPRLRESLREEHKTFAEAGTTGGARWTPFKSTSAAVIGYVQRHPGVSMKELLDNVETHYTSKASARACLLRWIEQGVIEGVEVVREGRRVTLYPA